MKKLYISFADADIDNTFRIALTKHLRQLVRNGSIALCSRADRPNGADSMAWREAEMVSADVILLLWSSDYRGDDESEAEYQIALSQLRSGGTPLVSILLRPNRAWANSEVAGFQPSRNGRAVERADNDTAWLEVVKELESLCASMPPSTRSAALPPSVTPQEMLIKIATDVESVLAGQKRMEDGISQLIQLSAAQKAEIVQVIQLIDENRFSESQMIEALQLIDEFVQLHVHQLSAEVKAQFEAMKTKDLEVQKRFKWSIPIIPLILSYELDIQDNSKQKSANGFWKALKQGRVML